MTHSLAERLRALRELADRMRAEWDYSDAGAIDGGRLDELDALLDPALDALTPDPAPAGGVEDGPCSCGRPELIRPIHGGYGLRCSACGANWKAPTPPVDLRREVAERIAADIVVECVARSGTRRGVSWWDSHEDWLKARNAILDKHLSADDEERAAEREVVEAALAWSDVTKPLTECATKLYHACDALRAVRARRKTK